MKNSPSEYPRDHKAKTVSNPRKQNKKLHIRIKISSKTQQEKNFEH